MEEDPPNLQERFLDVQSRLCSIFELAVDQVLVEGTTEERLVDAEIRLMRIHDLVTDSERGAMTEEESIQIRRGSRRSEGARPGRLGDSRLGRGAWTCGEDDRGLPGADTSP
jgi:hypothetical protein